MSVELAKAFCVRLMSDDDFRDAVGRASTAKEIADLVAANNYTFTKHDLLKTVSELAGKKIDMEHLSAMICEVYEEEIKSGDSGSTEAVAEWLAGLQ